jgi:hypothetical protein
MVDSSRHFLPLAVIRRTLDSLPYAKLNVLHWHVSDTQSFPFQSKSRPLYAKNGCFEPFYIQMRSFCQDRLGANIGKTQKTCPFLRLDREGAFSPQERYTQVRKTPLFEPFMHLKNDRLEYPAARQPL